jgi:ubiquinone/menaquinone biosynthesis C-methylase UbiE
MMKHIKELEKKAKNSSYEINKWIKTISSVAQKLDWIEDNSQDMIYSNFLLMNFLWCQWLWETLLGEKNEIKKTISESMRKLKKWWNFIIIDRKNGDDDLDIIEILDELWYADKKFLNKEKYFICKIKNIKS